MVDSGVDLSTSLAAARSFRLETGRIVDAEALRDEIGHATNTIRLIRGGAPRTPLAVAQVFFGSLTTTPESVAAAIDWLAGLGAAIINLSLGTTTDSPALRDSCRRALEAGRILVASVPACGPQVFPAAYEGIVRVTGDARCSPDEFSWVGAARVDVGACPRLDDHRSGGAGGASIAAARVTAALGALLETGIPRGDSLSALRMGCTIVGPQAPRARPRTLTPLA